MEKDIIDNIINEANTKLPIYLNNKNIDGFKLHLETELKIHTSMTRYNILSFISKFKNQDDTIDCKSLFNAIKNNETSSPDYQNISYSILSKANKKHPVYDEYCNESENLLLIPLYKKITEYRENILSNIKTFLLGKNNITIENIAEQINKIKEKNQKELGLTASKISVKI